VEGEETGSILFFSFYFQEENKMDLRVVYHVQDGVRYYLNYNILKDKVIQFFTSPTAKGIFRELNSADSEDDMKLLQVYVNHSWKCVEFCNTNKCFQATDSCKTDSCLNFMKETGTDNYIFCFTNNNPRNPTLSSLKFNTKKSLLSQVNSISKIEDYSDYLWKMIPKDPFPPFIIFVAMVMCL